MSLPQNRPSGPALTCDRNIAEPSRVPLRCPAPSCAVLCCAVPPKGIVLSALRNAGQTCICANRVFVAEAVYDQLAEAVAERVRKLKVGPRL